MNYLFLTITLVAILIVLGIAVFTNFELTNDQYDRLKYVVVRWHYLVVFVALIVKTFDVPMGVETVTIVSGIGAMLAGLLGISGENYSQDFDEDDYEFHDELDDEELEDIDEEAENAKEESGEIDG